MHFHCEYLQPAIPETFTNYAIFKNKLHMNYLQHGRTSPQICRLEDHKYLLWSSSAKMHIQVFVVIWQGSDLTWSSQEHHSKVTGTFLPSFMSGKPAMHPLQGVMENTSQKSPTCCLYSDITYLCVWMQL